jgi:hypothetical protein
MQVVFTIPRGDLGVQCLPFSKPKREISDEDASVLYLKESGALEAGWGEIH